MDLCGPLGVRLGALAEVLFPWSFTGVPEGSQAENPRMWLGGTPHLVSREGVPHNHLPVLRREETDSSVMAWKSSELCPDRQAREAAEIRMIKPLPLM